MAEKKILTRIINKHATEEEWNNHPDFIPMKSEIIVYDKDTTYQYQRIKIGDGVTPVIDLPFYGTNLQVTAFKPSFSCMWFKPLESELIIHDAVYDLSTGNLMIPEENIVYDETTGNLNILY